MENKGWIKLYRKFNDTAFKNKPLVVALFIDLLTNANHLKKTIIFNGKPLTIEAGELVTGRKELSKRTGISQQSIRSGLVTLKSTSTITITPTNKFSVITILNWKDYQGLTSKPTNKQPTSNQQATTNKNVLRMYKNDNKEKVKTFTNKENFTYDEKTKTYKLIKIL